MMAVEHRRNVAMGGAARAEGTLARTIREGAVGGVLAGIVFAVFEMAVAVVNMGVLDAAWMPLRMIGATVLGAGALMSDHSLAQAATTGLLVHMVLSALFGVVFAAATVAVPALSRSTVFMVGSATLYGVLLWLVNFYLIAPLAGWDWFPDGADQFWQGFVAHTFVFGTLLGLYLAARLRRAAAGSPHGGDGP